MKKIYLPRNLNLLITSIMMVVLFSGCATQKPYDYTAFKASRPKSILVLPPLNSTPDVNATYGLFSQVTFPLAESGYYVFPVTLVDQAFKENGLENPADIHNVQPEKLQEIFGADAVLYINIKQYGASYKIISGDTTVAAEAKLVDVKTGAVLWIGSAMASSAEQNNSSGGGLAGLLVKAIVNQIINSLSDNTFKYAGVASRRLLSAGYNSRILFGPRSPSYGKD